MLGSEFCLEFYLIPGFPFFEARDSGERDSGLKVSGGDAKNNPWNYSIRGFIGRDIRGLIGDPLILHLKLLTMQ